MKHPLRKSRGFTLVLVLSLLSILVLLTYTISSVSKVSVQISSSADNQTSARQNALIGLRIAMGELQQAAGGDVVTASASIRGLGTRYPYLMGVWPSGSTSALPLNWFVSGNFESAGTNQITYALLPTAESAITLVGGNTVTAQRDMIRAYRIEVGNGGYSFWIGDEGSKASLGFESSETPSAPSGIRLLADPRGEIPEFDYSSTRRSNVLVSDQIRLIAPGASLASRFHAYTARSSWINGSGGMQGGLFNINTTEVDAWAAILRIYNAARGGAPPIPDDEVATLAARLVGNFSQMSSSAKARFGPFRSVAGFWSSGIVQDSLDDALISTVAQEDIEPVLNPLLSVRSDTFRIRAYGDALNPADASVSGATPEAVAYCEAIVQRINQDDPLGNGKKFVITYFRWLGPDDI